jgi:hypothetical protein
MTIFSHMTISTWLTMPLLALGLSSIPRVAYAQVGFPPLPAAATQHDRRNIVKVDVLAPTAWIFARALNQRGYLLPVLVAYERTLRPRLAAGIEVQVGAIVPNARRMGFTLEGRYYLTLPDALHWLGGLYVAPRLRYLATRSDVDLPRPATIRGNWGGAEVLLGQQRPARIYWLSGLLTEASIGVSYWHRLRPDAPAASPDDKPFMQPGWQPTVRAAVGYSF